MTAEVSTSARFPAARTAEFSRRRVAIGFVNWAHALDHYVMLIFPTVVIGLEAAYARSYAELIGLGTASFIAFGVFSLPAGWLADRWSRRTMLALFYAGMLRKKNILATLAQSFGATCVITVLWMIIGYSIALCRLSQFAVGEQFSFDTAEGEKSMLYPLLIVHWYLVG